MTEIIFTDETVGAHSSFCGSINDTIEFCINRGMYSTQFFMGNPNSYKRRRISKEDIDKTLSLMKIYDMNIFTHFPYIANLCGRVDSPAWSGNVETDQTMCMIIEEIEYELGVISNFNIDGNSSGVVIHPGAFKNRQLGIDLISQTINRIKFPTHSKLILENSAGEGNKIARDFTEIKSIIDKIDNDKIINIGVCVDTAHIWGNGEYNLSHTDSVKKMFDDFDTIIGSEFFTLLHLNDSKVPFGSKKDRHEIIGEGFIWKDNKESLYYLINECKKRRIPIVLETDKFM